MSESKKYARQQAYMKSKCKGIYLTFVLSTDADILDHLDQQPNRQGYIKALIRADIDKQKKLKKF